MTDRPADGNAPPSDSVTRWVRHGRHVVPDLGSEDRLDRYLASRFTYRTRTQWVQIIRAGRIRVNGETARPGRVVRAGSVIEYDPERAEEPGVSFAITRLYEDEDLLALDKPPDLPVHPSGRYFENTLLTHLLKERGETLDAPGLRIVHRLDRETSGVIVFGKSREATSALARQFEGREAEKEYLLVVRGTPAEDAFVVDAPLGPRRGSAIRKAVGVVPPGEGKPASTEFRVRARGPEHALLAARPRTGRLHQIRVHAQHAGFPIVGDKMYGGDERFFLGFIEGRELTEAEAARLGHARQALHAFRLRLEHPRSRARLEIRAPLAADLRELCVRLAIEIGAEDPAPEPD